MVYFQSSNIIQEILESYKEFYIGQFIRLLHALQSIPKTIPYYQKQEWTNRSVPPDTLILHDFGDGPEPAIPMDSCGVSNDVVSTEVKPYYTEQYGVSNDVVSTEVKPYYTEQYGVSNDVVSVEIITE